LTSRWGNYINEPEPRRRNKCGCIVSHPVTYSVL